MYIVRANAPYSAPGAPTITSATRNGSDDVTLNWSAVANARGYSVWVSTDGTNYNKLAEHLVSTSYFDTSCRGMYAQYKVVAINGEGTGTSAIQISLSNNASPTTFAPTRVPTASPVSLGYCSDDRTQRCETAANCACGSQTAAALFDRKLQTCEGKTKKECTGCCQWSAGSCVSNGPPPPVTSSPTRQVRILNCCTLLHYLSNPKLLSCPFINHRHSRPRSPAHQPKVLLLASVR
jgi:hypothetical protein